MLCVGLSGTPLGNRFGKLYERRPDLAVRDGVATVAQNAGVSSERAAQIVAGAAAALRRDGLGQAAANKPQQACSPGYYPQAQCPDYVNYKLSVDPTGSGCQRCDPLSQVESSSENCMRALQFYLQGQGQLSLAAVTGKLNPETSAALQRRLGPSWAQYPGGACAILASFGTGVLPTGPGGYAPYYPPPATPPAELLLVGGGILALIFLLARKN